jgi:hypothetical protein
MRSVRDPVSRPLPYCSILGPNVLVDPERAVRDATERSTLICICLMKSELAALPDRWEKLSGERLKTADSIVELA